MAEQLQVKGTEKFARALARMTPSKNGQRILGNAIKRNAYRLQQDAATKRIKRGGTNPPLPDKLTSRTGSLRRSIGVDLGELPWSAAVGTALVYGRIHELGEGRYPVRAFLQPALRAVQPKFEAEVLRDWYNQGRESL